MKFIVEPQEHGLTLFAFLKSKCKEGFSANGIKRAIEGKSCRINNRVEFFSSYKVMEGDQIEIVLELQITTFFTVPILFEDEYFAIVNKPSGLLSQDDVFTKALGPKAKNWHLVHRLDKETSGLIVLAKTPQAEESAKSLFSKRDIQKIYLAIVEGKVKDKEGVIDNHLGRKGGYQGQTLYGEVKTGGLRAITHYRCLGHGNGSSLLTCDLKTGRTHQIRVHFSEKGHPLLGDYQYAKKTFKCAFSPDRHLLHAWKLSFVHPFTQEKIELKAEIPLDFQRALEALFLSSLCKSLNEK